MKRTRITLMRAALTAVEAERDRLRGALERIAASYSECMTGDIACSSSGRGAGYQCAHCIATAALKGET